MVAQSIARLALAAPLLLAPTIGCSGLGKRVAYRTVVVSDAAADELAEVWSGFVDRKIAECRAKGLKTPEERKECLGAAAHGKELEAALSALVAAQTAVKEAAKCEELKVECKDKIDWLELAGRVKDAWQAVKPFFEEVEK